jgi:hypothetical protein
LARRQVNGDEVNFFGDAQEKLGLALDAIGGRIAAFDWQHAYDLERTLWPRYRWKHLVEVDGLPDREFVEGHDLAASLAFSSERV